MEKDNKIKIVKLKEIYGIFREQDLNRLEFDVPIGTSVVYCYDMDKLKNELKNDGLKENIEVMELGSKLPLVENNYIKRIEQYKYCVRDGNHRCLALEELYGEDYEIPVTIIPNHYQRESLEKIWQKGKEYIVNEVHSNSPEHFRKLFQNDYSSAVHKRPEDDKIFQEEVSKMTDLEIDIHSSRELRRRQSLQVGRRGSTKRHHFTPIIPRHNTEYVYNIANSIPKEL